MNHLLVLLISIVCCTPILQAQTFTNADYQKQEVRIKMRDGIYLFTAIYSPKDQRQSYPILVQRTPYSCSPYGEASAKEIIYNPELVAAGYIFVIQDMRGRWNSEGDFENTKPPYSFWDSGKTDEVTDSHDTFDWLISNLTNHNGKIGIVGNSYLGWTALVAGVSKHPNLKAVLAMAPVTNFYFEDFNRYGLLGLNYLPVLDAFGLQSVPTTRAWWNLNEKEFVVNNYMETYEDYYQFFLDRTSIKNIESIVHPENFFWKNIKAHPTYDDFRKKRNWLQYLDRIECPTMIVGGWNDEQNLYGILNSFKTIDAENKHIEAQLLLGPWSHGHHKSRDSAYYLGNIFYEFNLSKTYQESIELPFFEFHLKGKGAAPDFHARVYDMGSKTWHEFERNPFQTTANTTFYLGSNEKLTETMDSSKIAYNYHSNPRKPVPFIEGDEFHFMAPKHYMTDDQRFASKRPDVLTFKTEILEDDITVRGEIEAILKFATSHQDADLYVKIIDVLPMDRNPESTDKEGIKMNGYQQLVRVGYIRGRYRNGFEEGIPFIPNQKTEVRVPMLEVFHTFKRGHRIMVQIQSSMFPLFDLNPQKWVDDIYEAEKSDFEAALHRIYPDSRILLPVIKPKD